MIDGAGIYAIENCRTGRVYIGATRRGFFHRWKAHRFLLIAGTHPSLDLQRDWLEYGSGWFKCIPLKELSPEESFARHEQAWIDRLTAEGMVCYNVAQARECPLREEVQPIVMPYGEVFTLQEIAKYFRVNVVTVRSFIRTGRLAAFRLGKNWRVTQKARDNFMTRQASSIDQIGVIEDHAS